MRTSFRSAAKRLADQRGFTLIELLTVMLISLVVFGAVVMTVVVSLHQEANTHNRANALDDAEVAMAQMTKDFRQGTISTATATAATVTVNGRAIQWSCATSGTGCTRTVSGASRRFATALSNANVFTYFCQSSTTGALQSYPAACSGLPLSYVRINLVVSMACHGDGHTIASCPSRTVTVNDGVSLRNA